MQIETAPRVRGALIAPMVDWLGQLAAQRRIGLDRLEQRLGAGAHEVLLTRPRPDAWVGLPKARALIEVLLETHGGRIDGTLHELGRRTVAGTKELAGIRRAGLAHQLEELLPVGRWRPVRAGLPGDLVELHVEQPTGVVLVDWMAGLLGRALDPLETNWLDVRARRESPTRTIFVRCAR